ncbi:MAG TPA: putative porin [Chthoniobacteraceae bacterium]|jgi:hypothetical protein|nr:putative porin [Chthoniobacteraceae bacterium]
MLLKKILPGALALCALSPVPLHAAEDSALLKILVKKGVLTEKEALNIQAESQEQAAAEKAVSSASKIKLSDSISELKLYGDLRNRYRYDNRDFQVDPLGIGNDKDHSPNSNQRSRFQFRLRLNADFKLGPDWFGGVELSTNYASDSGNQTYQDGFSKYPIFISRAYLGYNAADWLTVVLGKQPNPFYSTEMVWDPDISPAGFTQRFSLTNLFAPKAGAGTYAKDKDGKVIAGAEPEKSPWDITLVAGQLFFDDNAESGGRDPGTRDHDSTNDSYIFETQLITSYRFNKTTKLTIAPAWLIYNAASFTTNSTLTSAFGDVNENPFQDSATVSGATRHLNIINAPGDLSFAIGHTPAKFYWDFAYNIEGKSRAEDIYDLVDRTKRLDGGTDVRTQHRDADDLAWLVGFQLGENKKKGDWSFFANYRRTGISSVDPNLNDSDFALAELNTHGYKLSLAYNLADFAEFRASWSQAWNIRHDLVQGQATKGNAIADANEAEVLMLDLTVKF